MDDKQPKQRTKNDVWILVFVLLYFSNLSRRQILTWAFEER